MCVLKTSLEMGKILSDSVNMWTNLDREVEKSI